MSDTLRVKGALLKYSLLNMLLWAEFCCIFSYTTVFLLGRGLSNSEIGITVALGNLLAVAIQPFLASFADSGKIAIHKLLMLLFGAMLVLFGLAAAFTNILLSAAVFAGLSIFIQNAPGFLNSLGMYYQNHGASMNYGVAPASVSYADERFGERDKNKAQGLVVMVSTIGGIIGSLLGGWLLDIASVQTMLLVGTAVSVLGSCVAVLGVQQKTS